MKSSPPSDDQTQINVEFSHLAICDDSNGRIIKWYIIVSKGSGRKGMSFLFVCLTMVYLLTETSISKTIVVVICLCV